MYPVFIDITMNCSSSLPSSVYLTSYRKRDVICMGGPSAKPVPAGWTKFRPRSVRQGYVLIHAEATPLLSVHLGMWGWGWVSGEEEGLGHQYIARWCRPHVAVDEQSWLFSDDDQFRVFPLKLPSLFQGLEASSCRINRLAATIFWKGPEFGVVVFSK